MPVCCNQEQIEFEDESVTTIAYTSLMQQQYGNTPRVFVYYLDTLTGEYYLSNAFFTRVSFESGVITVDHGGLNSGYVVVR